MAGAGNRFGARRQELEEAGYVYEKRRDPKAATWQYRIPEEPVQQTMGLAS
jgi:hypothetical protein